MGSVHSNYFKCRDCGNIYEIDDGYGDRVDRRCTLAKKGAGKPKPNRPPYTGGVTKVKASNPTVPVQRADESTKSRRNGWLVKTQKKEM